MAWAGLIELGLFLLLGGIVLWVFFKPLKKANKTNKQNKR